MSAVIFFDEEAAGGDPSVRLPGVVTSLCLEAARQVSECGQFHVGTSHVVGVIFNRIHPHPATGLIESAGLTPLRWREATESARCGRERLLPAPTSEEMVVRYRARHLELGTPPEVVDERVAELLGVVPVAMTEELARVLRPTRGTQPTSFDQASLASALLAEPRSAASDLVADAGIDVEHLVRTLAAFSRA